MIKLSNNILARDLELKYTKFFSIYILLVLLALIVHAHMKSYSL